MLGNQGLESWFQVRQVVVDRQGSQGSQTCKAMTFPQEFPQVGGTLFIYLFTVLGLSKWKFPRGQEFPPVSWIKIIKLPNRQIALLPDDT